MGERKNKILAMIVTLIVLVGALITAIFMLVKDDGNTSAGSGSGNTPSIKIYASSISVSDMFIKTDSEDISIGYIVAPSNATVKPTFTITNGNSIKLSEEKVEILTTGTTEISYSINKTKDITITGTFNIVVLDVSLSTSTNMKFGKKADGTYQNQTLTINSNYPMSNDEVDLTSSGVINLSDLSFSSDNKTITCNFNITSSECSFSISVYDNLYHINCSATPYVSSINYELENNLPFVDNAYQFYLINSLENSNIAKQNGHYPDATLTVESNNDNAVNVSSSDNNVIKIENNKLVAVAIGEAQITLSATDGSLFTKSFKCKVNNVDVALQTNTQNVNINRDKNETFTISTVVTPNYALNKNVNINFDNTFLQNNNNVFSALKYGVTTISIYLNSVLTKEINVNITGNNSLKIIDTLTNAELSENINTSTYFCFYISAKDYLNNTLSATNFNIEIINADYEIQLYNNSVEITFAEIGTATMKIISEAYGIDHTYNITISG